MLTRLSQLWNRNVCLGTSTEAQKNVAARENSIIHLEDDQGERYKNFDMSPDALMQENSIICF